MPVIFDYLARKVDFMTPRELKYARKSLVSIVLSRDCAMTDYESRLLSRIELRLHQFNMRPSRPAVR